MLINFVSFSHSEIISKANRSRLEIIKTSALSEVYINLTKKVRSTAKRNYFYMKTDTFRIELKICYIFGHIFGNQVPILSFCIPLPATSHESNAIIR